MPWKRAILIVDDEPAVRRAVARLLSAAGYRIYEAADGGEALQVLSEHPGAIDLVLTDVRMPGIDGAELVRTIGERWPRQRVAYMSGHSGDVLAPYDLAASGIPFIAKPFTREELLAEVAAAMEGGA